MVSIIVPIYNKQEYIENIINSIERQTYKNYEIILVDDGSEDLSLEICKKISLANKKIKIVSQGNQGPSAARNTGIKNANGEEIVFIDADDNIASNYLEELVNASKNTDLAICGFNIFKENKNKEVVRILNKKEKETIKIKDIVKLMQKELFNSVCNKIFKTEIIVNHNIKFETRYNLGEDGLFVIEYLKHIRTDIKVLNMPLYYYSLRESGINLGTKENIEQRIERILYTKSQVYELYEINDLHDYSEINNEYFKSIITLMARYLVKNKKKSFIKKRKEIKKIINKDETKQLFKSTDYTLCAFLARNGLILLAYFVVK